MAFEPRRPRRLERSWHDAPAQGGLSSITDFHLKALKQLKGDAIFIASPFACLAYCVVEISLRHPAFQFFPLPIAAWLILAAREVNLESRAWFDDKWVKVIWWAHVIVALVGFIWTSPAVVGLALLLFSMAFGRAVGGAGAYPLCRWYYGALTLFIIPPPMAWDARLHHLLSEAAAALGQPMLDKLGVLHALQGVVVVTAQKKFFVDQACSGTNTMLVSMAIALVFCSLKRRPWGHALGVVLFAALTSVLTNVLRILLVIKGTVSWGMALDQGLAHELVGVAAFGLDLVFVASADALCSLVLDTWPELPMPGDHKPQGGKTAPRAWHWINFAAALVGLACVTFSLHAEGGNARVAEANSGMAHFQLPATLVGWEREGDKEVEDSLVEHVGVRNQVWLYHKGSMDAYVAMNYPFSGFHDTRECYLGNGWAIEGQHEEKLKGDQVAMARRLELKKLAETGRANLWLLLLSAKGDPEPFPSEVTSERLTNRLIPHWQWESATPNAEASTYVLQVLVPDSILSQSDTEAIRELAAAARGQVAKVIGVGAPLAAKEEAKP